jgi:hypothetical protein
VQRSCCCQGPLSPLAVLALCALHAHSRRGLSPSALRATAQVDPLWTVSQRRTCAPSAQKLPQAAVLAAVPTYKQWPDTPQVGVRTLH